MRVSLNLATAPSFRERFGLWVAVPGFVAAFAVLVWLAVSAVSDFGRLRSAEHSLTQIQMKQQDLRIREAAVRKDLARPEMQRLIRETQYVNELIGERQFSLTELTSKVSKLMPPDVRLDGMTLVRPGGQPLIRFTVESKTEQALETFLIHLEGSTDFSDVIVTSQGYAQSGSNAGPILTGCTVHYLGGALGPETQTGFDADTETANNPSSH